MTLDHLTLRPVIPLALYQSKEDKKQPEKPHTLADLVAESEPLPVSTLQKIPTPLLPRPIGTPRISTLRLPPGFEHLFSTEAADKRYADQVTAGGTAGERASRSQKKRAKFCTRILL